MRAAFLGLGVIFSIAAAANALAQVKAADPLRGHALSQRVCATCHIVASGQTGAATVGIPTFPAIARAPEQSTEHLIAKMMVPHPPMPAIALTTDEMRDIAAYILSLRKAE